MLDEFQYAPNLISAVKEASDKLEPGEKGKFLLTGSADIFRSARTQEALPGHMARLELFPLSLSEIACHNTMCADFGICHEGWEPGQQKCVSKKHITLSTIDAKAVFVPHAGHYIPGANSPLLSGDRF